MPDIGSWCANFVGIAGLLLISGCAQSTGSTTPMAEPKLYQKWELQPGSVVAGYPVTGGLGDVSIVLNGQSVYAPYDGETRQDKRGCLYFETSIVPAYLFRFCGLHSLTLGKVQEKQAIGKGEMLQFAVLRRQGDDSWAIVEPDRTLVERTLKR
jgi:hypothetical protein